MLAAKKDVVAATRSSFQPRQLIDAASKKASQKALAFRERLQVPTGAEAKNYIATAEETYLEERLVFKNPKPFRGTFVVGIGMFLCSMAHAVAIRFVYPETFDLRHQQCAWGLAIASIFNFVATLLLLRSFNNHGKGISLNGQATRQEIVLELMESYEDVQVGGMFHTCVGLCLFCGYDIIGMLEGRHSTVRVTVTTCLFVVFGCLIGLACMVVASSSEPSTLLRLAESDSQCPMKRPSNKLWNLLLNTLIYAGWSVPLFLLTCPR